VIVHQKLKRLSQRSKEKMKIQKQVLMMMKKIPKMYATTTMTSPYDKKYLEDTHCDSPFCKVRRELQYA
jgi:hypothetical protein